MGNPLYRIVNGDLTEGAKIILRRIEIGEIVLNNVPVSIIHTIDAPLLIGQSALKKFGNFSIDYSNNLLITGKADSCKSIENPKDIYDYFVRANLKWDQGNYIGAIQDHSKIIEIDSTNWFAFYSRGVIKDELKDFYGAIQDYNRSIEIDQTKAYPFFGRAVAKQKLNDYYGALQDLNKSIEIDSIDSYAFYCRGFLKGELNDNLGAIQDFSRSIEINPNYSDAYYYRGLVKISMVNFNGACLDFSKAAELGMEEANIMINEYCK